MAGDTPTLGGSDKDLRVYDDGSCPLCRAEIDHDRRCEGAGRLDFVDVGRDAGADLGEDLRILGFRPVLPLAEAAYGFSLPLRPWLARLRFARMRRG